MTGFEGEDPDRKYRLPYLADGVKNPKKKKKRRKGKRERKGEGSNQATGKVRCAWPEFAVLFTHGLVSVHMCSTPFMHSLLRVCTAELLLVFHTHLRSR
jgi:hypothetical protein